MRDYADPSYWRLDEHQAAVFSCDTPLLGIAGPGSGKTRTIIAKAARLIQANNNDPRSVALVTFTKNAALEMQARLSKALPDVKVTNCFIGTFHALAFQMLKRHWVESGVKRKLLEPVEIYRLVQDAGRVVGAKATVNQLMDDIGKFKAFPTDHAFKDDVVGGEAFQVFQAYERARMESQAIDVNDMVRECVAGLRGGFIKPLPVKHMLADEMQDADLVQIEFVLAHCRAGVIPTLVADDDQSIYAFRSAAGFRGLKMYCEATGAVILPMTSNYRSCQSIVEAASLVIAASPDRFSKTITAKSTEEGVIRIESGWKEEGEQAKGLLTWFGKQLQSNHGFSAAAIARTNIELDVIELACHTFGAPFRRMDSGDFFKRKHIGCALLALKVALNTQDAIGFASACAITTLTESALNQVHQFFTERDGSEHVMDTAFHVDLLKGLKKDNQSAFREFRESMADWIDAAEADDEATLGPAIVKLLAGFSKNHKAPRAQKDLIFLGKMLADWSKGSLAQRLNVIMRKDNNKAQTKEGAITICSAHASKGMEFDGVWVINADNTTWPNEKSEGPEIAEERRLFYVAITRPKTELVISHCQATCLTEFMDPVLFQHHAEKETPTAVSMTPEQAFIAAATPASSTAAPQSKQVETANA